MRGYISRSRLLLALCAAALALTLGAAAAYAAAKVTYSGQTSQHEAISLSIHAGKVSNLSFRIDVRCPHHQTRRFTAHGFSSFALTGGHFDKKFKSPNGSVTAHVTGHLKGSRITGTVSFDDLPLSCSGKTKYVLHRQHRPAHH